MHNGKLKLLTDLFYKYDACKQCNRLWEYSKCLCAPVVTEYNILNGTRIFNACPRPPLSPIFEGSNIQLDAIVTLFIE